MAYRFKVSRRESNAMFGRTANVGKRVNIKPQSMRGGIRF